MSQKHTKKQKGEARQRIIDHPANSVTQDA